MSGLLAELGLGRQSFYDTFGSKRELFVRVIKHYRSTQLATVLQILDGREEPLGRVRAAVRFFQELANEQNMRGCLVANTLLEVSANDEELRALLTETLQLLEIAFRKALLAARHNGDLPASKSPRSIARALTNASIGLAVTGRLGPDDRVVADIYDGILAMLR